MVLGNDGDFVMDVARSEPEHMVAVGGQSAARIVGIQSDSVRIVESISQRHRDLGAGPTAHRSAHGERRGDVGVTGNGPHENVHHTTIRVQN